MVPSKLGEDPTMADTQVSLDAQERDYLIRVLETALKNHRIEEHRTRTPTYREQIIAEEKLLGQLLTKLGKPQ
jgi:hypothetical protein